MYFKLKAPLNGFYLDLRRYTNKLIIIIISVTFIILYIYFLLSVFV